MTITIALINQKGGCGKSSTCFHLAGALSGSGSSVLLIDADPQGSLSQGFFGSAMVEELSTLETVAALFDEATFFSSRYHLVRPTHVERISVSPANQLLSPFNTPAPESSGMDQFVLHEFIQDQPRFDFVIIDCPPNLYRCSWTALVAADYVIIPVPPEDFGTQGLRAVHQAVDNARILNPRLRRLGHLVTRCDGRLLIHRSYEERLRMLYPELVFETVIPEASAFKVALACRKPVEQYSPRSLSAEKTRQLANEILRRIAAKNRKRNVA